MSRYYLSALLLLCCFSVIKDSLGLFIRWDLRHIEVNDFSAEGRLALGGTLSLWSLDMYELELLPRISDTLAKRILVQRAEIHARASTLGKHEKYLALEVVKGLGPKSVKRLSGLLDLSSPDPARVSSR
ncbi:MAG: hypothetical protein J0M12_01905 [Deltaproteobacteria bacterium]|nr:hypothetical protein [Deltaproteobacteria bacterium]